jgi:hypothetical protein
MFWNNDPSQLVANAKGNSVTEKRLTKTGGRILRTGYLKDRPIIDYLEEGEQPHFIFPSRSHGVMLHIGGVRNEIDPEPITHAAFATLTDKRVFVIVPRPEGDVECGVYYEYAHAARFQTGGTSHQMDIAAGDDGFTFQISNGIKAREVEAARDFIMPWLSSDRVPGSVINTPEFEVANDAFDFDFDVDISGSTVKGGGGQLSGGQNTPHRSENRSEIEDPELVETLRGLDAYSFEELIADIWTQRGWNAVATAESGDRGIDVVAERRDPIPEKQLIQAKKYKQGNTVGSSDIQQYSSLRHQQPGVDVVVVVTTSTFTKQAREIAEDLNVKLVDIDMLCEIIRLEDAYDIVRWHAGERGTGDSVDEEGDTTTETTLDSSEQDGEASRNSEPDPVEEIRRIRELEEEGLISEDEFNAKKQELLDRI